jgi:hypothetical protein
VTGARLSPVGALAWLASLSTDMRAAAVLDADGGLLAGDADLGRSAAAALAASPGAGEARDGDLLVVRGAGGAVAAALGPRALVRVARLDLATAAEALRPT